MGIALLKETENEISILGLTTFRKIGWDMESVKEAGRRINAKWIRNKELRWKDIDVIIEGPTPRYYNRANQVHIIRIWWQAYHFLQYFLRKARSVRIVDSFEWNRRPDARQYTDEQRLENFQLAFPDYPGGGNNMNRWGNKDTRDAALIGYYDWNKYRRKKDDS